MRSLEVGRYGDDPAPDPVALGIDDRAREPDAYEEGRVTMNLDGLVMYVSSTAERGVVDADTRLRFRQTGSRVLGRYSGGAVTRGVLVGRLTGTQLAFRYAQVEASGEIHGGRSRCDVERHADGRTRIVEHFTWRTRHGSGTNTFDELP